MPPARRAIQQIWAAGDRPDHAAGLSTGATVVADTGFSGSTPSDGDVVAEPVTIDSLVFAAAAEPLGDGAPWVVQCQPVAVQ